MLNQETLSSFDRRAHDPVLTRENTAKGCEVVGCVLETSLEEHVSVRVDQAELMKGTTPIDASEDIGGI